MPNNEYDSKKDVLFHKVLVSNYIALFVVTLLGRASNHDNSKLKSPEKELFDEYIPKLESCEYGSDEYKAHIKEMGKALQHHYQENSHHPEHYDNGIDGMTLMDIVEMYCDWKAANDKLGNDFKKGLKYNKERFGMSDQLYHIFENTHDSE